ncbi:uncharacterized protein LOC120084986 [Benincasa hispida]|uniref:uncharacterized protein LOC120084986 n=1 Tax=Benincasa hispida TaxID=102211 RepID=UPI001901B672|nr:uncharacterized protein LOC120084986 [Benincasa hispida]
MCYGNQYVGLEQKNSSRPHQQQGCVYSITLQEAENSGTVVIGTLPILGHHALVLFDSESSRSFILSIFDKHAMLELELLCYVLSVSTPSREIILAKEKIKVCQIEVASRTLNVTLIVLDMRDFDVILGMDWLIDNHASIDCSRKEVISNPPAEARFKFKGVGTVVLPKVISTMKTKRLLNQGTWSILASVVDTRELEVFFEENQIQGFP